MPIPHLAKWPESYCKYKGWDFSVIDRHGEPEEIKEMEGASMPWKVAEAVRAGGWQSPQDLLRDRSSRKGAGFRDGGKGSNRGFRADLRDSEALS